MDQVDQTISVFFASLLGHSPQIDITHTDDEIQVHLQLDPSDSSLFIGYRGEALQSMQLILSLITQQQAGHWLPVRLDINDYRQKRQAALENLALNAASKALEVNKPVSLVDLSSYERRIVHTALSDNPQITTESQGEPPHRVLIIKPA